MINKFNIVSFILALIVLVPSYGQEVEHNYLVGPGFTTCDSLNLVGLDLEKSIKLIRSAKFRFNQEFKLTRKIGLQMGEYYSCDGRLGFLIIKYDDCVTLYQNVKKEIWAEMKSSADPEGFYLDKKPLLQKGL